ncbi:hypothetical protein SANTM175S_11029 [Streptomyces antimycoticus]
MNRPEMSKCCRWAKRPVPAAMNSPVAAASAFRSPSDQLSHNFRAVVRKSAARV